MPRRADDPDWVFFRGFGAKRREDIDVVAEDVSWTCPDLFLICIFFHSYLIPPIIWKYLLKNLIKKAETLIADLSQFHALNSKNLKKSTVFCFLFYSYLFHIPSVFTSSLAIIHLPIFRISHHMHLIMGLFLLSPFARRLQRPHHFHCFLTFIPLPYTLCIYIRGITKF